MLNCAVDTTNNDTNDNLLNAADDDRSGGLYDDDDFFDNRQQQQQQSQQYFNNKEMISSTTDIESPAINNTNTAVATIRSPSSLASTPRTPRSNKSNSNNTSHMSLNDIESNNNIIISSKPQSIISPLANPSFPISVDDGPISPSSISRSQRSFASVAPSITSTKTWDDHYAENNNIIDGDRSNDHITWNNFNNTHKSDGLLYDEDNGIMKDDITKGRRKRKLVCILLVLVCLGAIAAGGVALHQALTNNGNGSNNSNANLISDTEEKGGSGVAGQDGENKNVVPTYEPTFYPTITQEEDGENNEDVISTGAPVQSPTINNEEVAEDTIWTEDQDTSPADQETNEQAESSPSSSEEESGVTIWTGTETDTIHDSGASEQEVSDQEEDTAPNNNEDEVVPAPFPLDTQEEDEAGNGQQEESVSSPSTTTPGVGFGVTIEDVLTPSPVSSTSVPPPPQPSTEPNESNGSNTNNPPPSPPVATTSVPTQRITNSPIINPVTTSIPTTKNPTPNPTPPPSIPVNNNLDTLDAVVASDTALSFKDAFLQSGTQTLNIQLKTDQYGEETSWTLYKVDIDTNMETNMIESVDENTYVANEQVNLDITLSPGKYRFTLRDQFGDGFCCSNGSDGWYRVYLDNEEIFRGGWYRQEISHDILVGFDWESTMNERDNEWLIAHNIRREDWHQRNNGLPGYVPLKWSTELAKDAQSWADELLDDCDQEGIAHESDVEEGENLAKNFGNGGQWAGLYPPENILKRWVDDEEFWGYPRNAHLTQALWRASRYVGCGDSIRTNSEGVTCRMQVCRYVRAGNCAMGSFQAKEGDNWMVSL